MSKRNKIIKLSVESIALKDLRENAGLSLRKLADLMDLSFVRIHQMESGREDIPEEYVRKFLKATDYSWEQWLKRTRRKKPSDAIRVKCHQALDSIDPSKLKMIYELLKSF